MPVNLSDSLNAAVDFQTYRHGMSQIAEGETKDESLDHFTKMNHTRMERLYKSLHLSDEQKERLQTVNQNFDLLIISEAWCGDAAQILPVIELMLQELPEVEAKIIYRDQHPEIMEQYLTNGARAIPIVIGLDKNQKTELFHWGPRPKPAKELLKKHKAAPETYPKEQFYRDLQMWYNRDKGGHIVAELIALFPKK